MAADVTALSVENSGSESTVPCIMHYVCLGLVGI